MMDAMNAAVERLLELNETAWQAWQVAYTLAETAVQRSAVLLATVGWAMSIDEADEHEWVRQWFIAHGWRVGESTLRIASKLDAFVTERAARGYATPVEVALALRFWAYDPYTKVRFLWRCLLPLCDTTRDR